MTTRPSNRSGRSKSAANADKKIPVLHDSVEESPASLNADGLGERSATSVPDVKLHGKLKPLADRDTRIAEAAYRRAEQRGFQPGHELEDWLAAEREIDAVWGALDGSSTTQ